MKTFNHLYEVYDRKDKIVIAQGTKEECEKLEKERWYWCTRFAKTSYISIDELPNLIETYLEEGFISTQLGYINPEKFIKEKFGL